MKALFIILWVIISLIFWIMSVATKVENPQFKHYEFRIRSFFYWLSVIFSFLIGFLINFK